MNNRSLIFAVALTVAAPAAVLADETPAAAPVVSTGTTAKPAKAAKAAECNYRTGTRIRTSNKPVCSGFGPMRVYTQRDVEMTGEVNLGEALRKLDPIFR
ncbi:MAG: hypothetical protein ABI859_06550 [Pseudomonadota bacterium]